MNRYGKRVDGKFVYHSANNPIILENGDFLVTTDSQTLIEHGYKEIIYTRPDPEEGYQASAWDWEETETQYIQKWNYELLEEEVYIPSTEERLEAIEAAMLELIELMYGGDM